MVEVHDRDLSKMLYEPHRYRKLQRLFAFFKCILRAASRGGEKHKLQNEKRSKTKSAQQWANFSREKL